KTMGMGDKWQFDSDPSDFHTPRRCAAHRVVYALRDDVQAEPRSPTLAQSLSLASTCKLCQQPRGVDQEEDFTMDNVTAPQTCSRSAWITLWSLSEREDSGYVACQELQTGAKTEAV
ncbi:unnamed protein product, partial [Pleuronectes platessa]